MSNTTSERILHPTLRHPLTGKPLEAVGVLPSGRIVWPMMGGDPSNDPPERPEGVSEEEWNALGDPGKAAIVRERTARQEAERQLAAARARPTPPPAPPAPTPPAPPTPPTPPAPAPPAGGQQQPDIAAIVQQAVEAAVKPFKEREEQRDTQAAAQKVADEVTKAAKDLLHDPDDALTGINLTLVVNDQGQYDPVKGKAEIDALIARKPHLAKSGQRFAPPGIGGGAPAQLSDADKVKNVLADMQKVSGVRLPSSTN